MSRPRRPARPVEVAARRGLLALVASLSALCGRSLEAQESSTIDEKGAVVRIEASVTAVTGGSVYLDKGRTSLLEPGDLVAIRPLGGTPVPAIIRSVSRTSARAELPAGVTSVGIADRAEILIPAERVVAAGGKLPGGTGDAAPEHPPWSAEEQGFDPSQPLLAPTWAKPAAELPMKVYGRYFAQWNGTWDDQYGNSFFYVRTGADITVENPYGAGGELHIAGDLSQRTTELSNAPDDQSAFTRLDRASYVWGGTRDESDRIEVGRFVQHAFPELGLLDGAEAAHRTASGHIYGGSVGAMPEPFPGLNTGRDTQAAIFYRTDPAREQPLEYGIAYQNTWHEFSQDRNLFVGNLTSRVSEDVTVFADALVDYYGPGGDDIKGGGFQVTEARANGTWRVAPDTGVGVHVSHIRWPEIKRNEFGSLTPQQVKDNEVTRLGSDAWHDVTEHLRVDGRADVWRDQNDEGASGNLRAALRNVAWEDGDIAVDVFLTAGAYTNGRGVRLSGSRNFESLGYGTLSWESSQYDSTSLINGSSNLLQQALRASLDTNLGDGWSASMYAEKRYGDSQDSHTVGIFLQRRF